MTVTPAQNIRESTCLNEPAWDSNLRTGMKKVDFIFFDAGGGHRSAATALKSVIGQQLRTWSPQLVNLQEELDSLDIFRKLTGIRMEDIYNRLLANGWTLGSQYLLPSMHGIIRLYHPAQVRALADFWKRSDPAMVVSFVPNFNRALFQSLRQAKPETPFVTVLTDFADYPPHFWLENQDHHVICGTEKAYRQALASGKRRDRVFLVSGMILRPAFYEWIPRDRATERSSIGLHPAKPTGLILFGGQGSSVISKIVRRLHRTKLDLQLIAICGRNRKLADHLRSQKFRIPVHIVEFTSEIPYLMSLSDFFIGKPGPGSISEALAMKLPVIVERNAWTLPQERYNAEWVQEKNAGIVLGSFSGIGKAVAQMLEPGRLAEFRDSIARVQNRAVFEIPDILERILHGQA